VAVAAVVVPQVVAVIVFHLGLMTKLNGWNDWAIMVPHSVPEAFSFVEPVAVPVQITLASVMALLLDVVGEELTVGPLLAQSLALGGRIDVVNVLKLVVVPMAQVAGEEGVTVDIWRCGGWGRGWGCCCWGSGCGGCSCGCGCCCRGCGSGSCSGCGSCCCWSRSCSWSWWPGTSVKVRGGRATHTTLAGVNEVAAEEEVAGRSKVREVLALPRYLTTALILTFSRRRRGPVVRDNI